MKLDFSIAFDFANDDKQEESDSFIDQESQENEQQEGELNQNFQNQDMKDDNQINEDGVDENYVQANLVSVPQLINTNIVDFNLDMEEQPDCQEEQA